MKAFCRPALALAIPNQTTILISLYFRICSRSNGLLFHISWIRLPICNKSDSNVPNSLIQAMLACRSSSTLDAPKVNTTANNMAGSRKVIWLGYKSYPVVHTAESAWCTYTRHPSLWFQFLRSVPPGSRITFRMSSWCWVAEFLLHLLCSTADTIHNIATWLEKRCRLERLEQAVQSIKRVQRYLPQDAGVHI